MYFNMPAANMTALKYSLELEGLASDWASQCQNGHPENMKDKHGKDYGQNEAFFNG